LPFHGPCRRTIRVIRKGGQEAARQERRSRSGSQDEMRVGQKNGLVYQWAKKGTRPRQPKDQRYANAYVFGAICPARDTGVDGLSSRFRRTTP
jgi:hypothetical protein